MRLFILIAALAFIGCNSKKVAEQKPIKWENVSDDRQYTMVEALPDSSFRITFDTARYVSLVNKKGEVIIKRIRHEEYYDCQRSDSDIVLY